MLCATYRCAREAVIKIEYGTEQGNRMRGGVPLTAICCSEHANELWNRSEKMVENGFMYWRNISLEG